MAEAFVYEDVKPKGKEQESQKADPDPDVDTNVDDDGDNGDDSNPDLESALAQGWKPQNEWKGDPKKWVDYGEFLYRGELMARIMDQSKIIKNVNDKLSRQEKTIERFKEHHEKVAQIEYERARKALLNQKKQALAEDDHDAVVDIDEELKDLKEDFESTKETAKQTSQESTTNSDPTPELDRWLNDPKNSWYKTDEVMNVYADKKFAEYMKNHPDDFTGGLHAAEVAVQKAFPNYFTGKKVYKASVAEGSDTGRSKARNTGGKKTITAKNLNEEQRAVGKNFVDSGLIDSLDAYAQDLYDLGEIE